MMKSTESTREEWTARLLKHAIPEHMRYAIVSYVLEGCPVGDFLRAVLCNDLTEAFGRADIHNRHAMFEWAALLHNDMPASAWGDGEAVDAWMARGGLVGHGMITDNDS